MEFGTELLIVIGICGAILTLFFLNQPFPIQMEGVLGSAILLLWVVVSDTRKKYQRKRGKAYAS